MATMIKEKRREKKKTKEKSTVEATVIEEILINAPEPMVVENTSTPGLSIEREIKNSEQTETLNKLTKLSVTHTTNKEIPLSQTLAGDKPINHNLSANSNEKSLNMASISQRLQMECKGLEDLSNISQLELTKEGQKLTVKTVDLTVNRTVPVKSVENITDNYEYLNERLERIAIPKLTVPITKAREKQLSDPDAYLKPSTQMATLSVPYEHQIESAVPSAPMFEEEIQPQIQYQQEQIQDTKIKLQCLPLEEAVNIFGGKEMIAVKMMSEKEEAIVEAGPISGPEHPLVDLLSTFKSSLRALENERSRLTCGFADEDKSRSTLWKVEKRNIYQKKQCKCGASVELRATYEYAQLLKERMPVARLQLEGLLRDIQDSYCHYQHAALLAYCQIEELISETIGGNKPAIREALSLVLHALRVSDDSAAAALPAALQRWAAALVAALLDDRDVTHLLFLLHHLFRQSRSVRWAARALRPRVPDAPAAARALAVLHTLLASPRLDAALECTEEDADEGWEEVSVRGAGGAVSEGALREIDLLALLHAFPLRDLVARILQFTHADIRQARTYEWGDARGGRDVMSACCGVRALVAALQRASDAHAQYARLRRKLLLIVVAALEGLSRLYQSPRAPYDNALQEKIQAELEACFIAAFNLFGTQDLHKLDTALLADNTAKDYCVTFMIGLHDTTPREIDSMLIYAPVLPCSVRVRILSCASQRRRTDHELARIVLDFLLQTGGKADSPPASCKAGCGAAARAQLARLLAAHPYLRTAALHAVADLAQVASLDPSLVSALRVGLWRPGCDDMQAVLQDWAQRCPQLLHQLLLQLDCTPFTGLSLPVQLTVGAWLCERQRSKPADAELCWRVLLRLRTHRACWRLPPDAPAPDPDPDPDPADLFSNAYALLASSWGHSIPLICSRGVEALCALGVRTRTQVHCLAPVMLLMAHSPDSVSLTPRFLELFTSILNCGPSLVQRALGRGGVSGNELLLRLVLSQIEDEQRDRGGRVSVFPAWLTALWRVPLRAAAAALDAAAVAARQWPALDTHANILLQEENAKEHVSFAVRNASVAPLLCECLLRASHNRELSTQMFGALVNLLWEQRINGQKVHVDNALQKIKAGINSEELVIYRCANAALVAPLQHPSHLALWRLFFHLYLQRPPNNMRDTALPVGPLFFSGLLKSRTLTQLIKRLQETATHHRNEAETHKKTQPSQQSSNRVVKSSSITIEKGLLPALSIKDLTGESSDASDCDSDLSEESEEDSDIEEKKTVDTSDVDKKHAFNMACYHTAAERMVREYCGWLEDGDQVRASPHHADIARFIPEQALEAAWQESLSRSRPPPSEELDEFPRPVTAPDSPPEQENTPLDEAIHSIMKIKDRSGTRPQRVLRSPLEDVDVRNSNKFFDAVDKYLKSIETFAVEWTGEVNRISSLDRKLWELVATLRVPRPLPPVTAPCPSSATKKCKPILFYIEEREWCISTGAERGIKENRSSWASAVRALTRPRPAAARTAAQLHSIARRVRDKVSAVSAAERVWRAAGAHAAHCPAARAALTAALQTLAERWIQQDAESVVQILGRWCAGSGTPLQQALCGALVAPRHLHTDSWPRVYGTLLNAKLPSHAIFSYLSKFEMSQWSRCAAPEARRELLAALVAAQTRHGSVPAQEHSILLELLGLHTAAVLNSDELPAVVMQFASLAVDGKLPPRQWSHLVNAVAATGDRVTFDRLGYLLGELGALWWRARSVHNGGSQVVPHAEYAAAVQGRLARALGARARALSYHPERVGRCVWSALQESWSAWIAPHPATPPLLPSTAAEGDSEYCLMLHRFLALLEDVMADCPGSEVVILQSVFEWSCACHAACRGGARREGRVQAGALLAALAHLPWADHQWFAGHCLQVATQTCATNDVEITSWCCARWGRTAAATLLRDVTDATLAARLDTLLYLFTGTPLPHAQHILDEATKLPWRRLPEPALGDALDRFFMTHHDSAHAYHDFPQFQVLLHASLLRVHAAECDSTAASRDRRARAVSAWCRAAAAPALHAHCAGHARAVLHTLTALGPCLEESSGELEELVGRAAVVMCVEPAAAAALPVWRSWVEGTSARMMRACITAACALTAPAYCALLADTAIRAYLTTNESSWSEVVSIWRGASPWREASEFTSRACLHAAYACARAARPPQGARAALLALHAATPTIDFVANEVIVAVWICYACACACAGDVAGSEARPAAAALVRAWAQPARRSLLKLVTLQPDTDRTTARHRVLCRLAECILAPSGDAAQAYELACAAAGGCDDVMSWGRGPRASRLPRLALALFPACERYFACELRPAGDTAH